MQWETDSWQTVVRRVWLGPFFVAMAPSQGWFLQRRKSRFGWYVELGAGRRVFALGYSGI